MVHDILFFEVTFTKWAQKTHISLQSTWASTLCLNLEAWGSCHDRFLMVFEIHIVKPSKTYPKTYPYQNTIDDISHLLFADACPGGIFRRLIGKSPDPRKSPAPSFLGSWDWERCMKSQVFLRSRVISDHFFATPIIVIAVIMNLWFVVTQGHGRERCVWHDVGFTCCFAIFSFHFKHRDVWYSEIIWDFIAKLRRFAFRFVCWEKRSWKSKQLCFKKIRDLRTLVHPYQVTQPHVPICQAPQSRGWRGVFVAKALIRDDVHLEDGQGDRELVLMDWDRQWQVMMLHALIYIQ